MPKLVEQPPEVTRQTKIVMATLRREMERQGTKMQTLRNAGVGARASKMLIQSEPGTCAGLSLATFALACDALGLELTVRAKTC